MHCLESPGHPRFASSCLVKSPFQPLRRSWLVWNQNEQAKASRQEGMKPAPLTFGRTGKLVNAIACGGVALRLPQLLHDSTKRPHLRLELLQALERRTCGLNTQNRSGNRQEMTFPQAEWGRAGAAIALVKAVATSCLALGAGSGLSCVNLWGPGQELDEPKEFLGAQYAMPVAA